MGGENLCARKQQDLNAVLLDRQQIGSSGTRHPGRCNRVFRGQGTQASPVIINRGFELLDTASDSQVRHGIDQMLRLLMMAKLDQTRRRLRSPLFVISECLSLAHIRQLAVST